MTNEQINIAIAEACGWNPPPEAMGNMTHGGGKFLSSEEWRKAHIPNYCKCLNAMHQAERTISDPQLWAEYQSYLSSDVMGSVGWICHATATERAEAFLKTIGKWKEQK